MSVAGFRVVLPPRAGWWLAHLAVQQNTTADKLMERWILERLHATPGVDLTRTPKLGER